MNSTAYPRHQRLRGFLVAALCTGLFSSCGLLRDVSHPDDETTRTETRQETGVNPRLAAFQSDPAYGPMLKGNLQAEVLIGKETYSSKVNAPSCEAKASTGPSCPSPSSRRRAYGSPLRA